MMNESFGIGGFVLSCVFAGVDIGVDIVGVRKVVIHSLVGG